MIQFFYILSGLVIIIGLLLFCYNMGWIFKKMIRVKSNKYFKEIKYKHNFLILSSKNKNK